ncbi:MAG: hypothetical protein IJ571_00575 [Ruminococcus sp.]|nr:hypothetical protein [Ruminococcus sp.]
MYKIMHKNRVIAKASNDSISEIMISELCPACFCEGMDLEFWLKSRSVDIHRSHSRQLYKALRLKTDSELPEIINIGHGISITDNWWIQRENENLDYCSLKEYNEDIARIAFSGSADKEITVKGYTELGTLGSYEKAWRYINDNWYMFKRENQAELISEYYSYCFLKQMNVPVADYKVQRTRSELGLTEECIITKDFTDNCRFDFEPFLNYFHDNEDHEYIVSKLKSIEAKQKVEGLTDSYVRMCFYDALLFNVDRHNVNAGFLRDSETGKIVSLAPCYDYNLALGATKTPRFNKSGDLMKYFTASESCLYRIGELLPTKADIIAALKEATKITKEAFPIIDFEYSIFEKYVLSAYDYCAETMQILKKGF